jgi:hypothetical protein
MTSKRIESINETASIEKQPSLLGTLILALLTITLYSCGIHQSSKTVTDLVEAGVKEAVRNYQFSETSRS